MNGWSDIWMLYSAKKRRKIPMLSIIISIILRCQFGSVAKIYHLQSGSHLQSHLHAFNFIRNVSAHHSRLWNRAIVFKASLKGLSDKQWQALSVRKVFVYFCLMKRMLDVICPNSKWNERFLALLDEFPQVENGAVSLKQMGVELDPKLWRLWQTNS